MLLDEFLFRPSATVSRIGLMESCTCRCRWCGGPPPLASWPPSRDGWLGRSAFALTKRTCFGIHQFSRSVLWFLFGFRLGMNEARWWHYLCSLCLCSIVVLSIQQCSNGFTPPGLQHRNQLTSAQDTRQLTLVLDADKRPQFSVDESTALSNELGLDSGLCYVNSASTKFS